MANESGKLDDLELDDNFDFDFDDFDIESNSNPEVKSDSRSVVTDAVKGSIAGAKSTIVNTSNIKNLILKALPKEYGEAYEEVDNGLYDLSRLYDDSIDQLKPKVNQFSSKLNNIIPDKYKKAKDILDKVSKGTKKDERHQGESADSIEQRSIDLETNKIFDQAERTEELVKETVDNKKFKVGLDVNTATRDSIQRLTDYTTTITQAYQKKSLELQYRSYFVQNKILNTSDKFFKIFSVQNEAIVKNTALPEYVKTQDMERFKEANKARIINKLQDKLFDDKGLISTVVKNLKTEAQSLISGIGEGLEAGTSLVDMQETMQEMSDLTGEAKESTGTRVGKFVGSTAGDFYTNKLANKVRDYIPEDGKISNLGLRMSSYLKDPSMLQEDIANSEFAREAEYGSFKEMGSTFLSDLLKNPRGSIDTDLNVGLKDAIGSTDYSARRDKSIVEVIPGYLSRILNEVTGIRKGSISDNLTTYDYNRGSFTDMVSMGNNIEKQLSSKLGNSLSSSPVTSMINETLSEGVQGGDLSAKTRKISNELFKGSTLNANEKREASRLITEVVTSKGVTDTEGLVQELKNIDSSTATNVINAISSANSNSNISKITEHVTKGLGLTTQEQQDAERLMSELVVVKGVSNPRTLLKELKRSDNPIAAKLASSTESNLVNGTALQENNFINDTLNARSNLSNLQPDVKELIAGGHKEILLKRGIITESESGKTSIDREKYLDLLQGKVSAERESLTNIGREVPPPVPPAPVSPTISSMSEESATPRSLLDMDVGEVIESKITELFNAITGRFSRSTERTEYTSTDSNIVDALEPLQPIKSDIHQMLEILQDGLVIKGMGTTGSSSSNGDVSGNENFDSLTGHVKRIAKSTVGTIGSLSKSVLDLLGNGVSGSMKLGGKSLTSIKDFLKDKDIKGGISDFVNNTLKTGGNVLSFLFEKGSSLLKTAKDQAVKMFGLGGSLVSKGVKKLLEYAGDVYVKGSDLPVLRANLLKLGHYLDQKTGEVIKSVSDINGPVVDLDGNIILTLDDIKNGLLDNKGMGIKLPTERILSFFKEQGAAAIGRLKSFGSAVGSMFRSPIDGIKNISFDGLGNSKSYDVLVEIRNILRSKLGTDEGVNDNVTSVGPISSIVNTTAFNDRDNSGTRDNGVEDRLAEETDREDQAETTQEPSDSDPRYRSSNILDSITGTVSKTVGKITGKKIPTISSIKDKAKGTLDSIKEKGLKTSLSDLLTKPSFNDRDNSGTRDNSVEDRLAEETKREEANAKGAKAADLDPRYRSGNVIDKMMGMMGGIMGKASGVFDTIGDLVGGKGSKGIIGTLGRLLKGGLGKVLGKVGSVGGSLASVASRVPGLATVGRVASGARTALLAGSMVTGGLGSAAMGVLGAATTALTAALSSPVILGAAAIGAAGYGAYKAFNYFTRNSYDKFEAIRLQQYGLNLDNDDSHVHELKALEKYLQDGKIKYTRGKADINDRVFKLEEALEIFSIDPGDEGQVSKFLDWFIKRFRPFFLTHLTAFFTVNNKGVLEDIPDLDDEQKVSYLNMVDFASGPYDVVTSPFKDLETLSNTKEQTLAAINELIKDLGGKKKDTSSKKNSMKKLTDSKKRKSLDRVDDKSKTATKKTSYLNDETSTSKFSPNKRLPNNPVSDGYRVKSYKAPIEEFTGEESSTTKTTIKQPATVSVGSSGKLPLDTGEYKSGEQGLNFLNLQKGVTLEGLNPVLLDNLKAMAEDYNETTGKSIQVNSGYRSPKEQERLYRQNPRKAARPGRSLHEFGLAVDMQTVQLNELDKLGLMRKYGFTRPVGGETWHTEPAGIQPYIQEAKHNPALATSLIKDSLGKGGGGVATVPGRPKNRRDTKYALSLFNAANDNVTKSTKDDQLKQSGLDNIKQASAPTTKTVNPVKGVSSAPANVIDIKTKKPLATISMKEAPAANKVDTLPDIESKPLNTTSSTVPKADPYKVKDGQVPKTVKKPPALLQSKPAPKVVDSGESMGMKTLNVTVGNVYETLNESLTVQENMLQALMTIVANTTPEELKELQSEATKAAKRPVNSTNNEKPALNLNRRVL